VKDLFLFDDRLPLLCFWYRIALVGVGDPAKEGPFTVTVVNNISRMITHHLIIANNKRREP
jgi:hypothetical protein